jgi:hypothetical protein
VRAPPRRFLTLGAPHFIYMGAVLAVLLMVVGIVLLFPYGIYNFKCQQFDMPAYEEAFGFTFGEVTTTAEHPTHAITAVKPGGAFDRSGLRPGDVPRMHHGIGDFCGDLESARAGRAVHIRVYNVHDAFLGKDQVREVRLRMP